MNVTIYGSPEVIVEADAQVGEGPVWDHRTQRLCWVDIERGQLMESDLGAGTTSTTQIEGSLGAAVPRAAAPGFGVAVEAGFGILCDGELDVIDGVLPESSRRMNDAKCDSRGRLWAGSTHKEFVPGVGALHRWDGAGTSQEIASGFVLPNGLGWDVDDTRMYLVDSFAYLLMVAGYDGSELTGDFEPLCAIHDGLPDGLAVDTDGCVWLAVWGGWVVCRYSPTGELLGRVPMPIAQPSSCAFGPDGTLYITSARSGLDDEQLAGQPLAGSVFALSTAVHGVPVGALAR